MLLLSETSNKQVKSGTEIITRKWLFRTSPWRPEEDSLVLLICNQKKTFETDVVLFMRACYRAVIDCLINILTSLWENIGSYRVCVCIKKPKILNSVNHVETFIDFHKSLLRITSKFMFCSMSRYVECLKQQKTLTNIIFSSSYEFRT